MIDTKDEKVRPLNTTFNSQDEYEAEVARGVTDFSGCIFNFEFISDAVDYKSDLQLAGVTFNKDVKFSSINFYGKTLFSTCIFEQKVSFNDCYFGNIANFSKCKFKQGITFEESIFSQMIIFTSGEFNCDLTFSETKFKDDVDMSYLDLQGKILFSYCTFDKTCDFTHIGIDHTHKAKKIVGLQTGIISYSFCRFKEQFDMHDTLLFGLSFDECTFEKTCYLPNPDNILQPSRSYFRLIKHLKIQEHDQIAALKVHTMEMEKHADEIFERVEIKKLKKKKTDNIEILKILKDDISKFHGNKQVEFNEILHTIIVFIVQLVFVIVIIGASDLYFRALSLVIFLIFSVLFISQFKSTILNLIHYLNFQPVEYNILRKQIKQQKKRICKLNRNLFVEYLKNLEDRIIIIILNFSLFGTSWAMGIFLFLNIALIVAYIETYIDMKVRGLDWIIFIDHMLTTFVKTLNPTAFISTFNFSEHDMPFWWMLLKNSLKVLWAAFYGAMTWQIIRAFRKFSRSL